ncbi:MAG TPA: hypothetical protein VGQ71_00325, partial [Terriglobales bacterium]|nr:hypothetical protein [Terriglobales bacterium]
HIPGVSISQAIEDCLNVNVPNAVVRCGEVLQTANGVKVGQVGDDVNNLIGAPNQDTWGGLGQYRDGTTGDLKDTSRSLVTVAVWDDCKDEITSGKQDFTIVGFAQVFMDAIRSGGPGGKHIDAHLVSVASCSKGVGSGTGTGPSATPVRLVQTPTP